MSRRSSKRVAPDHELDDELLRAVRGIPGVLDADIRMNPQGEWILSLELVSGAQERAVSEQVVAVLDGRKWGVQVTGVPRVIVEAEPTGTPPRSPSSVRRVRLEQVQVVTGELESWVEVTLACDGRRFYGSASGPILQRSVLRSAASATVRAINNLLAARASCGVEYVDVLGIGADHLVVVLVVMSLGRYSERLPGVALVRDDAGQAAARATLTALNRRLDRLLVDDPYPAPSQRRADSMPLADGEPISVPASEPYWEPPRASTVDTSSESMEVPVAESVEAPVAESNLEPRMWVSSEERSPTLASWRPLELPPGEAPEIVDRDFGWRDDR